MAHRLAIDPNGKSQRGHGDHPPPRPRWPPPAAGTCRKETAKLRALTGRPVHEEHVRAAHGRIAGPTYVEQAAIDGNVVVDNVANRMAAQVPIERTRSYDQRYSGIPQEYEGQYLLTHNGAILNGHIRGIVTTGQDQRTAARVYRSGAACSRMVCLAARGDTHQDATTAARRGLGTPELSSVV